MSDILAPNWNEPMVNVILAICFYGFLLLLRFWAKTQTLEQQLRSILGLISILLLYLFVCYLETLVPGFGSGSLISMAVELI